MKHYLYLLTVFLFTTTAQAQVMIDTTTETRANDQDIDQIADQYDNKPNDIIDKTTPWNSQNPLFIKDIQHHKNKSEKIINSGDAIVINGKGFDDETDNNTIVFEAPDWTYNIKPEQATHRKIVVETPPKHSHRLFVSVATDNRLSNAQLIETHSPETPLINQKATQNNKPHLIKDLLTLKGQQLGHVDRVHFNGATQKPLHTTSDSVRVTIPDKARSGDVYVQSEKGRSNAIDLSIHRKVSVSLEPSSHSNLKSTNIEVFTGIGYRNAVTLKEAKKTTLSVPNRDATLIKSRIKDTESPLWSGFILPTEDAITLSPKTTATAKTIQFSQLGGFRDVHQAPNDYFETIVHDAIRVRDQIGAMEGVKRLGERFATTFSQDPRQLESLYRQRHLFTDSFKTTVNEVNQTFILNDFKQ